MIRKYLYTFLGFLMMTCVYPAIGMAGQNADVVVSAGGVRAIGTLIVSVSPSAAERKDIQDELSWRVGFNGVFSPLDTASLPAAFRQKAAEGSIDWSLAGSIDASLVLVARWANAGEDSSLQLQAYQAGSAKPVFDRSFSAKGTRIHTVYDAAVNSLYKALSGYDGPFGDKIYFQKREPKSRTRELAVMELGFSVENRVTLGQRIVLKPRSNPQGDSILFIGYANAVPEIWKLDVRTGKLTRPVPNSAPAYGAVMDESGAIYFSHARGRYAELIKFVRGRRKILQEARSMNLGIDLLETDQTYVFSSDRFGNPHIFVSEGEAVRRLTIDGEYNAAPRLSPDGKWIAFARREGGRFSIFAVSRDGATIRRLTDDNGTDEDPVWSNDSRTVYFSSDRNGKGRTNLFAVDLYTGRLNQITSSAGDERMPAVLRRP